MTIRVAINGHGAVDDGDLIVPSIDKEGGTNTMKIVQVSEARTA